MAKEIEARLKLSAIDRTRKAFDSVSRNLDRIDRKSRAVDRAQRSAARSNMINRQVVTTRAATMSMLGLNSAVAAIGSGVAFKELVSTTADFESALTGIQKKAGTTADETARLGKEALALSTSGELAVSLEEVLSAMERGAAAGLPLDELREFARLSAMAADAFEMSAEDVGNAAAGFKVSMGISIGGMEEYFGLINKLADAGIADERDIVAFLDRAGANLKMFGLTAEQAAAYGATLSNIKMQPEVAARMMNSLTTKLLSPASDKAAGALEDIVGNMTDFQDLLKSDGNKAIEFFLDKVAELDKFKAAEGLTGFLGQGFADEVLRLSAARDELARNQKIALDRDSWKGSLGESYDLKLDDFWPQLQLLKNDFNKLTIDVGMTGMPAFKDALELARDTTKEIGEGLDNLRAEVDFEEVAAATTAVAELGAAVAELLDMDPDSSAILGLFDNIANLATITSGSILTIKDGLQALGIVAQDDDTDADLANRYKRLDEAYRDFNPLYDNIRTLTSGPGEPELTTILKADPNATIDAPPETGDLGVTTGNAALPSSRPDPAAVAAEVAKLQDIALEAAKSVGQGSIKAPPLAYPQVAPGIDPENVDRDWHGWGQTAPIVIPDHSADGSSGWRGGGFDEGRFGDDALAVQGIDELRQAMEGGGQSVAQGGRDAQAAIDLSGAQLPTRGQEAGQGIAQGGAGLPGQGDAAGRAFSSAAGSALVGQAQAAGAAMARAFNANVRVPSAPSGGSLVGGMAGGATRPTAKSMPDAGVAGGQ